MGINEFPLFFLRAFRLHVVERLVECVQPCEDVVAYGRIFRREFLHHVIHALPVVNLLVHIFLNPLGNRIEQILFLTVNQEFLLGFIIGFSASRVNGLFLPCLAVREFAEGTSCDVGVGHRATKFFVVVGEICKEVLDALEEFAERHMCTVLPRELVAAEGFSDVLFDCAAAFAKLLGERGFLAVTKQDVHGDMQHFVIRRALLSGFREGDDGVFADRHFIAVDLDVHVARDAVVALGLRFFFGRELNAVRHPDF